MEELLTISHLSKSFPLRGGARFFAVEDVSLTIHVGETVGVVGESGCGKSTLARMIMGAYQPTKGEIRYRGEPVRQRSAKQRAAFAQRVQMVFQDPYASLDPRQTAGAIIAEPLQIQGKHSREACHARVHELLEQVGLSPAHATRFPHEFSGGQRQRIGIARALAVHPELLLCDEPISALDISVQSQIVNLLQSLRQELSLSFLFIAHDLNMVRYLSDRIAVMYLGNLVELADAAALCDHPLHPYTVALLSAVLTPDPAARREEQPVLPTENDAAPHTTQGCVFAPRCPHAQARCHSERPTLTPRENGRFLACHLR